MTFLIIGAGMYGLVSFVLWDFTWVADTSWWMRMMFAALWLVFTMAALDFVPGSDEDG